MILIDQPTAINKRHAGKMCRVSDDGELLRWRSDKHVRVVVGELTKVAEDGHFFIRGLERARVLKMWRIQSDVV